MRIRVVTLNVWNTEGPEGRGAIINAELRRLKGDTWTVDNPNAAKGAEQIVRQKNYRHRFDYVLAGSWDAHPKAHAKVARAVRAFDKPVKGIWPSDHFGLCVDLNVGINEPPRARGT
jgi:hypothetical protein